ncbi:MAG: (Fe-S)-binding protein [Desulfobacterales bacterium]
MKPAIELDDFRPELKDLINENVPGANLDLCLTCGTCAGGCPATELMGMDPRKFLRMLLLGMDDVVMKSNWAWVCTMCSRCMHGCPMKINIPKMVYTIRSMWPREKRPKGILGSCDQHIRTGNAMGVPKDDFIWTVKDVAEEIRETDEQFRDLSVTVDRPGAYIALNQNSREPVTEPDELGPLWKILHIVGADWTYPSIMWAGENYCMFLGDNEGWRYILEEFVNHIDLTLGSRLVVNTECGHSHYAIWEGLQKFKIPHRFEYKSIMELYAQWIREGKLPVSSEWNKEKKIKFTLQDPCNIVRKSYGDKMAEDLRFVLKHTVGEENIIEMIPNRSNNFCCGGGGGALQAGFPEERKAYGKVKFDQIRATGAKYVVVPCHNCHSQILDLAKVYGGDYHVVHYWTIICLAMGVLGENEREYLGPDLKNIMQ